jgi:hypothetical protein
MTRRLIVCLAAFHLLSMTTASPAYAGACPEGWAYYCTYIVCGPEGQGVKDICYTLNQDTGQYQVLLCLCDNYPQDYCDELDLAGCSGCCRVPGQ